MIRPSWKEYFIALAFIVASRSKDQNTCHGTILTDKDNTIISTAYNGPIRQINDNLIPKTRPDKYLYFLHSEINSVLNCKANPKYINGARAYITGKCCNHCLQVLINFGVDEFFMAKRRGTVLENEETDRVFKFLVDNTGVKVEYVDVNFDWIKQFLDEIKV